MVLDPNSTPQMQAELEADLRRERPAFPFRGSGMLRFSDSSKTRLIQLADLVAGAVRRSVVGEAHAFREIEDKMIDLQSEPPEV